MIKIKKYIPCTKEYLLKLYVLLCALTCFLVFIKSCQNYPFSEMIGKALLGPTIMFFIVSPVFGLIFTNKSINTCKFHLPYQYIKSIQVDEYSQRLILTYNYNVCLGRKSKKEYQYKINTNNYKTTLTELIQCFPENIERKYN